MRTIAATPATRARHHPEWSPWLMVLAEARRALDDPLWARAVPAVTQGAPSSSPRPAPLLHDARLTVDAAGTDRFIRRLFGVAGESGESAAALRAAAHDPRLDPRALLEAAIRQDARCLDDWAAGLGVEPPVLRAVAAVAVTPLLHACRRAWNDGPPAGWRQGYCPVCGAWPTFAEARGLERSRQLRCARCGGDWRTDWLRCPYCDNADHTRLGALVAAAPLETRKVETCEACRGYVKSITTLRATPVDEVTLVDLDTVELDIAALERGYARPDEPACVMRTRVVGDAL
jgi:FdhE protein